MRILRGPGNEAYLSLMRTMSPTGRDFLSPDEMTGAAVFLASDGFLRHALSNRPSRCRMGRLVRIFRLNTSDPLLCELPMLAIGQTAITAILELLPKKSP